MPKIIFMLLFAGFLISSCSSADENEIEIVPEVEVPTVATGILNETEWKANKRFVSYEDDLVSFGLKQEKDEIGCPHHELVFDNIPFKIGTYRLSSIYTHGPRENIVNTNLYYTCGDAVIAPYDVEDDVESFITITSVSTDAIHGEFTTDFILDDKFPDAPPIFEFVSVEFQIEL